MYNIVKIGSKDVPMLSMASVDVYYRNIFHEDPLKIQTDENADAGVMIGFIQRMGFVMAKFADLKDRKEMLKLNEDAFYEWMDNHERNDLINALPDIQATYEGQSLPTSEAKKNNEEPSGE